MRHPIPACHNGRMAPQAAAAAVAETASVAVLMR